MGEGGGAEVSEDEERACAGDACELEREEPECCTVGANATTC